MKWSEISLLMKAFDNDSDRKVTMKEWLDGFKNYKDPPRKVEPTTIISTEDDIRGAKIAARKLYHAF